MKTGDRYRHRQSGALGTLKVDQFGFTLWYDTPQISPSEGGKGAKAHCVSFIDVREFEEVFAPAEEGDGWLPDGLRR